MFFHEIRGVAKWSGRTQALISFWSLWIGQKNRTNSVDLSSFGSAILVCYIQPQPLSPPNWCVSWVDDSYTQYNGNMTSFPLTTQLWKENISLRFPFERDDWCACVCGWCVNVCELFRFACEKRNKYPCSVSSCW